MRYDLIVLGGVVTGARARTSICVGGKGVLAHTACCAAGWQAE